ncbi:MAG: hypothetical protein ACTSXW_04830 [Candidatus Baldrarchaeia archaeon]
MSTSVKINLESKKKLEELQAMLTLKLGRKIPQHEILDALIKLGSSNVDELVKHFSGVELPLPQEKVAKILSLPCDWGVKTSEEDINKILYEKED